MSLCASSLNVARQINHLMFALIDHFASFHNEDARRSLARFSQAQFFFYHRVLVFWSASIIYARSEKPCIVVSPNAPHRLK